MTTRATLRLPAVDPARLDPLRVGGVMVLAAALVVSALTVLPPGLPARSGLAAGLSMIVVVAAMMLRGLLRRRSASRLIEGIAGFIEKDATPSFVVDEDGAVLAQNRAAGQRFSAEPDREVTLAHLLRAVFANPSAVLRRLQSRARVDGAAREDVVTRRGHVRLAVHDMGAPGFLWRVEDMPDRGASSGADRLPLPMITLGRTGAVLYMNAAARALVGTRAKTLSSLFAALPVRSGAVNRISTASGPRPVHVTEHLASGGRRELYLVQMSDDDAERPAYWSLPVPMLTIAPDGTLEALNGEAASLFGAEGRIGTPVDRVMQGLGRPVADWLRDARSGPAGRATEFLRLTRPDIEMFVQVTLTPVGEGDETRLLAVLNDATELKTLEAQFVQSQKMQAIGQLAGGVAHDFNNLLTAISGHCDLLLLRHDQGDPDYGDLVQVHQNANRAAALVGQLLAFSRKQTLRPEVLDLRDTLADLTHLLNRLVGEKVTLTLSHDPVLRPIWADKRQLEQVLMNLVVNARDAMPSGGEIRIETEVAELDTPYKRDRATVPPGDYVTVRVRDEGVGIPSDKLEKIFEPFYTTKRTGEGTGLGLSTVYGIVKQTGGFIFVDSAPGTGTAFTLYFPVHEGVEPVVAAPVPEPVIEPARHGDGVVLLVEDEAPVRAFASRALRLRGYTVLEAENAEEALETLSDPDLVVDVFVTDVVMPGMDGPTWVREALKDRPEARVVFMSGYAEGAFGETGPAVPHSVFLPKPFSLNQLTETVYAQMH